MHFRRGPCVYWLDILNSRVLWRSWKSDETGHIDLPSHVGAVLRVESNSWLVSLQDGVYRADIEFANLKLVAPFNHDTDPLDTLNFARMRSNDAKIAPNGHGYFGTLAYDPEDFPESGNLYVLRDGKLTVAVPRTTISNGLGWDPDESRMYFIDSPSGSIDVFDWSAQDDLLNRRTFYEVDPQIGIPDGMCVDSEGNIWVAIWGGSCVLGVNRSGELIDRIELPTPNITSCCFVGPDLGHLAITTSDAETANSGYYGMTFLVPMSIPGSVHTLGRL
jgi:sugar lactone lactonase YvrE